MSLLTAGRFLPQSEGYSSTGFGPVGAVWGKPGTRATRSLSNCSIPVGLVRCGTRLPGDGIGDTDSSSLVGAFPLEKDGAPSLV